MPRAVGDGSKMGDDQKSCMAYVYAPSGEKAYLGAYSLAAAQRLLSLYPWRDMRARTRLLSARGGHCADAHLAFSGGSWRLKVSSPDYEGQFDVEVTAPQWMGFLAEGFLGWHAPAKSFARDGVATVHVQEILERLFAGNAKALWTFVDDFSPRPPARSGGLLERVRGR